LQDRQATNRLGLDQTIAGNEHLVNQYSAIRDGGGNMLGEGGNSFAQGYADMQQLAFTPDARQRLRDRVVKQTQTATAETPASSKKTTPEAKRRTTTNDTDNKKKTTPATSKTGASDPSKKQSQILIDRAKREVMPRPRPLAMDEDHNIGRFPIRKRPQY
jgi:hypothetical protein